MTAKKKLLFLILAAAAAIAVALLAYFLSSASPAEDDPEPMLNLNFNDIAQISVTTQEDGILTFSRTEDNNWMLQEDPDYNFDQNKIAAIASFFSFLRPEAYVAEDTPPENLGFQNPRVTVVAQLTDGSTHTLYVGADTADRTGIYLKLEGDSRIGIFDSYAVDTLRVTKAGLCNHRPRMISFDEFTELVISIPGSEDVTVTRQPDMPGSETPVLYIPQWSAYLDSAVYYRMVQEFGDLAFDTFVGQTEDLHAYGLDIPTCRYTFRDSAGVETVINLGYQTEDGDSYYASSSDDETLVFAVSRDKVSMMELSPVELLDRRLFVQLAQTMEELSAPASPVKTITAVTVQESAETIAEIVNQSGTILINGEELPPESGAALLTALMSLRTREFLPADAQLPETPSLTIHVDGTGFLVNTCNLYSLSGGRMAVGQNGSAPVFCLPAEDVEAFLAVLRSALT